MKNFKPYTLNPYKKPLNPKPLMKNSKPSTLNPYKKDPKRDPNLENYTTCFCRLGALEGSLKGTRGLLYRLPQRAPLKDVKICNIGALIIRIGFPLKGSIRVTL